jgi:CIC family chloride channel protein
MLSCILSTILAQRVYRASIYTVKLLRRGIDLEEGQEINVLRQIRIGDVMQPEVETVPRNASLDELHQRMVQSPHYEFFTIADDGSLVGVISVDDLRRSLPYFAELGSVAIAEDIASTPPLYVREDDTLDCAMRQFGKRTHEELPVLPAGESMVPVGVIQRHDVITAYNKEMLRADLGGGLSDRIGSAARLRTWETVGDYVLTMIQAPHHLCGQTLASLQLPQRRGIQVILIDRGGDRGHERYVLPGPDSTLDPGDRIIVFGKRESVNGLIRG